MRRATMFMLAVALVVGMTLPALATDVKFNGYYRVRGYNTNNVAVVKNVPTTTGGFSATTTTRAGANSYFDNRMDLYTTFTVNDKLTVLNELYFGDGEMGTGTSGYSGDTATATVGVSVRRLYVRYTPTKELTIEIGKLPWSWDSGYSVLKNRKWNGDGAVVYYKTGPGTVTLGYTNIKDCSDSSAPSNASCGSSGAGVAGAANDQDRDYFTLAYPFKVGTASLTPGFAFLRDSTIVAAPEKHYYPRLYGSAKFGAVSLQGEVAADLGKAGCTWLTSGAATQTTAFNSPQAQAANCSVINGGNEDVEYRAWAGYIQAGYNVGFGEVGLQYIYASGDNDPWDSSVKSWSSGNTIGGTANDQFSAIALRHQDETGLLFYKNGTGGNQGSNGIGTVTGAKSGRSLSNAQIVGAYGTFKVAGGDFLTNIFYAKANDVVVNNGSVLTSAQVAAGTAANQSKTYGTEWNAIFYYPILKELVVAGSAGYLWAGDYFKGGVSTVTLQNPWTVAWNMYATF